MAKRLNLNDFPDEEKLHHSEKMEEFLDKVDALCFEYGFEIWPTVNGWTGKTDENNEYESIAILGDNETVKVIGFDGDGRGK